MGDFRATTTIHKECPPCVVRPGTKSDFSTSTADTRCGELTVEGKPASLYARLGGYDAIAAVVDDLLPRLRSDVLLSRFWTSPRSVDTHNRERQLAVDFIASAAGGPTIYLGRDMKMSHKGMGITKADYEAFMRCLSVTLDTFKVPEPERSEVVAFTTGLEPEIVEA